MGNTFFRFKQFTVHQEACAMKVSTDACVLGAWAELGEAERVLDIGTGTGLLALMLAQRSPKAVIEAVELDGAAYEQARTNFAESTFDSRLKAIQARIQDFEPAVLYDSIICNPPFYQTDLRSPVATKNRAHHATELTLTELMLAVERLLSPSGCLNMLLPVRESKYFRAHLLGADWILTRQLYLAHSPHKEPFRELGTYRRNSALAASPSEQMLYIYDTDGTTHTEEFRRLLADFYLAF